MGSSPLVPYVDPRREAPEGPAAEIPLDELMEAREDPRLAALLKDAEAERQRVDREGRRRW
jgi:hypothetical protein